MIAEMADGAPRIVRHEGKIGIIAQDEGVDHGFLLRPADAITTATRILAGVADAYGRDRWSQPCDGIELTGGYDADGERGARLVLFIDKAPLAVDLSATQVAELAVALEAAANQIDEPLLPRRER